MKLSRCVGCRRPVLELEGQFELLDSLFIQSGRPAPETAGTWHASCLAASGVGAPWHAARLRNFLDVRGYRRIAELPAWTVLESPRDERRLALGRDGLLLPLSFDGRAAPREMPGGRIFAHAEEPFYLEFDAPVPELRRRLSASGTCPLHSILEALGILDLLLHPEALQTGELKALPKLPEPGEATSLAGRMEYGVFVPAALLPYAGLSAKTRMAIQTEGVARSLLEALDRPEEPEKERVFVREAVEPAKEQETPTSFEGWLAQGGELVAAWDDMDDAGQDLSLFRVGKEGARRVSGIKVPPAEREAMDERVLGRGLRLGQTYGSSEFVWAMDEKGCAVWSAKEVVSQGSRTSLLIAGHWTALRDIRRVCTFVDPADRGHRGVALVSEAGRRAVVVEEHDGTPAINPTYNRDNLLLDILWARYLGEDLATWLSLPHDDEFSGTSNEASLAVAAAARGLAVHIEGLPKEGPFEEVLWPAGEAAFRFAPNPLEPGRRFLELRVGTPSGRSFSGRWLKQGANRQVVDFLRRLRTPRLVLRTMHDLRIQLKRDGYA